MRSFDYGQAQRDGLIYTGHPWQEGVPHTTFPGDSKAISYSGTPKRALHGRDGNVFLVSYT